MNNFTDLTKEQLKLLDKEYLYFGSSIKHSVISANKFLTLLPGIASIFVINKNDLYQGINKYYNFINFEYDLWNKSINFLKEKQSKVKIYNNAKDWIKTKGVSEGYIHKIKLTDYIRNNLKVYNNSDVRYEIVYTGKKEIKVDSVIKHKIEWTCEFSEDCIAKYSEAGFVSKYDPPYSIEILKEKYPKLLKDEVHKWRAETGIELIHLEPTYEEQKRIFYNWLAMSDKDKEISDKKCKQLNNGLDNFMLHNVIMQENWHDENYTDLSKFRLMYNLRDMEANGLKYIHLSDSNKPLILKPRVPKNAIKGLEDNKIPRICVSNSIFGAISAIKGNQTLYVHLVEPIKVLDNAEVLQYVPDAVTTGESWVLDNEIKTTIVGKIEINCDLHMVYKFATYKDIDYYSFFKDYTFIPFESLTKRTARKVLLN